MIVCMCFSSRRILTYVHSSWLYGTYFYPSPGPLTPFLDFSMTGSTLPGLLSVVSKFIGRKDVYGYGKNFINLENPYVKGLLFNISVSMRRMHVTWYVIIDTSIDDSDRWHVCMHRSRSRIHVHVICAYRRILILPAGECDLLYIRSCLWWFQEHYIDLRHFRWLPKFPDMNVINYLEYIVQKKTPLPRTPKNFSSALKDSCCFYSPRYFKTLFVSMPRCVMVHLSPRVGFSQY